jgi:hypothetical protein
MRSFVWVLLALSVLSTNAAINTTDFWRESLGLAPIDMHFQSYAGSISLTQDTSASTGTLTMETCTISSLALSVVTSKMSILALLSSSGFKVDPEEAHSSAHSLKTGRSVSTMDVPPFFNTLGTTSDTPSSSTNH